MSKLRLFEAMGSFQECPGLMVPMVTAEDLADPAMIRGLRWSAFMQNVRPVDWVDHATNLYRDYPGTVFDRAGKTLSLDMTPLEEASMEWWRDFCCRPCSMAIVPRVRCEAMPRAIVLGTILRAASLADAYLWGLASPANLNWPPRDA